MKITLSEILLVYVSSQIYTISLRLKSIQIYTMSLRFKPPTLKHV